MYIQHSIWLGKTGKTKVVNKDWQFIIELSNSDKNEKKTTRKS